MKTFSYLLPLCVLLAGCRDTSPPKLAFVDSAGNVVFVGPGNAERFADKGTPTKVLKGLTGITWDIVYTDVVDGSGTGFDDPTSGAERQQRAEEVLTYIATVLDPAQSVILSVKFEASQSDGQGALASAGTLFSLSTGFQGDSHINISPRAATRRQATRTSTPQSISDMTSTPARTRRAPANRISSPSSSTR